MEHIERRGRERRSPKHAYAADALPSISKWCPYERRKGIPKEALGLGEKRRGRLEKRTPRKRRHNMVMVGAAAWLVRSPDV
jgi:hypothetical protein